MIHVLILNRLPFLGLVGSIANTIFSLVKDTPQETLSMFSMKDTSTHFSFIINVNETIWVSAWTLQQSALDDTMFDSPLK